ncbi:MAG: tetratricopeptide repeat protein, partial [Proteobacteria bacterium]|nr:tetratricopeptide repeat protein [Pseudomonadota bacterium]
WGFDELSWELQQQTGVLREITAILKTPSETKANEWRQMGEELRRRGVYDEAVKFFSKSIETNPLDYRTYVGLGQTHLRMKMFSDAKKYFEKGLPHAPSNFYKSYSLRLIGRIYYCREDYNHAIISLKEAVEFSPDYVEAGYDLAQYYAVKGDARNSLPLLGSVIEKNSLYFYLSEKERNFDPIRREAVQLHEEMKKEAYKEAQSVITKSKKALKGAEKRLGKFQVRKYDSKTKSTLKLAMDKAASGDYKSILEATPTAERVFDSAVVSEGKTPQAEEIQKLMQERLQTLNISAALHISFLFCFICTFLVSWWFYLIGAISEGLAHCFWNWEEKRSYYTDGHDPAFSGELFLIPALIFAPISFLFVFFYFGSKDWIKKSYEEGLNTISVFDDVLKEEEEKRKFEDIFKEDYSKENEDGEGWIR